MAALEPDDRHEGPWIRSGHPVRSHAGRHVVCEPFERLHVAVHVDRRVEVRALAAETRPAVEAGLRIHIDAHMPLAEHRRAIAGTLKALWERREPGKVER